MSDHDGVDNLAEIDLADGVISFRVPMFVVLTIVASLVVSWGTWSIAMDMQTLKNSQAIPSLQLAIDANQKAIRSSQEVLTTLAIKLERVEGDARVNSRAVELMSKQLSDEQTHQRQRELRELGRIQDG